MASSLFWSCLSLLFCTRSVYSQSIGSVLAENAKMESGERLESELGLYKVVMQTDGNLVGYDMDGNSFWSSGTHGEGTAPYKVTMQDDDNLVIRDSNGDALWASNTGGDNYEGVYATIKDNRNFVLYSDSGDVVWESGTAIPTPEPTGSPTFEPTEPSQSPTQQPTCVCTPECYNTATEDTTPDNPSIPDADYDGTPITDFYNEVVTIPRMDSLETVESAGWPRDDCPHEEDNLYEWHDDDTWDSGEIPSTDDEWIYIPTGKKVIIRSCSLTATESDPYQRIYIPEGSSLIFDDSDIELHVMEIMNAGNLQIGGENCRLYSNIHIYLHGTTDDSSLSFNDYSKPSKGIVNFATADIHGKQFHPTWTLLALTANIGDDRIYLQESVNWEVGQEIVIVTSIWTDYQDDHQNERKTIYAIGDSEWADNSVIYFGDDNDNEIEYQHYVGTEYQTEVMLITRNIKIEGYDSSDGSDDDESTFGGHYVNAWNSSIGRIEGVEGINMGQLNIEARYPFHFHWSTPTNNNYFKDCSVHDSNWRCWVIHATNNTVVERNTAYNINGHCLYIEDGIEENNEIKYNAVAFIHPLALEEHTLEGGCSGETICVGCSSSWEDEDEDYYNFDSDTINNPSDVAASGYYISNKHNRFIGNIASGGFSGYAMLVIEKPIFTSLGEDYGNNNPYNRPVLEFDGNVAHSSGFYWDANCASSVYGGGNLYYDDDEQAYMYETGKAQHDPTDSNGDDAFNNFTNVKVYLSRTGINYYGKRSIVRGYEFADGWRSMFVIDDFLLQNALVNARGDNEEGLESVEEASFSFDRVGWPFYDTSSRMFLDNVIFRNFEYGEPIILMNDKNDEFTVQGIGGVRAITYDNCDEDYAFFLYDEWCGEPCSERDGETSSDDDDYYWESQGSRNFAFYDYDGSATLTGLPTIIGTRRDFYNVNGDCMYDEDMILWFCPWYEQNENNAWNWGENYHNVAFLELYIPGLTEGEDSDFYDDDEDRTGTYTGYFSQFGRNYSSPYGVFPGAAGWTNTGWYFRSAYEAPAYWFIGNEIQIPRKSFVLLSMKYPKDTEFDIYLTFGGDEDEDEAVLNINITQADSLDTIAYTSEDLYDDYDDWECKTPNGDQSERRLCDVTGGLGPAWYFDSDTGFLYLRVVNPVFYGRGYYEDWKTQRWEIDGLIMYTHSTLYYYRVHAKCDGCDSNTENGYTFYTVEDSIPDELDFQNFDSTGYYDSYVNPQSDTTRSSANDDDSDNNNDDDSGSNNDDNDDAADEDEDASSGSSNSSSNSNDDTLFDMGNTTNLIIIIAVACGLILLIIGAIIMCRKRKNVSNVNRENKESGKGLLNEQPKNTQVQIVDM